MIITLCQLLSRISDLDWLFFMLQVEFSELESYQMKFFAMSLLAILTVVSCCLGMQYILNFVKNTQH